jgi:DNA polymerase-3 subunit epsilon
MPQGAFEVHGLGDEFLSSKPVFAKIAQGFLDFIGDSKLIIHNAAFDMKFLNAELKKVNLPTLPWKRALDTLAIARRKFPGSPASLDALCRRFNIDTSGRVLHGALLDSEILAEVYLELIGGRQPDFGLGAVESTQKASTNVGPIRVSARATPLPSRLTKEEAAAHDAFVEAMGDGALWSKLS